MKTAKEQLITWLNDAYGLEQNLTKVLEHRVKDVSDHPNMKAKVQQHLEQTRRHADLVKGCIERLGGKTSSVKSGMANISGTIQGLSTGAAKDEMVKNVLSDYSSEQFEIASYLSLISAATELGDQETVRICEQILKDEEDMASWLAQQIPNATKLYLQQHTGQQAQA